MFDIQTLHTVDTEYSADSIEWCPHPEYKNIFACGTYQLEENKDENATTTTTTTTTTTATTKQCNRKGRIYIYEFNKSSKELRELHRQETAAILDMKWLNSNLFKLPVLATATALGNIDVYQLENGGTLKLIQSTALNAEQQGDVLALALDWRTIVNGNNKQNDEILTSDSKGDIHLLAWSNERNLDIIRSWHAHNFEAWICAFDKWDRNRVYTGGDDTLLQVYDLRTDTRVCLNKSHMAGVTCLLSHPGREHILLSGSYDEHLRTFDTRSMKQPLGEINLRGGIWRLKVNPLEKDLILCASMYHNFSIVDLNDLAAPMLVGEFDEHKSICYGSDWCMDVGEIDRGNYYMATCSFYDHKLCIASVSKNAAL